MSQRAAEGELRAEMAAAQTAGQAAVQQGVAGRAAKGGLTAEMAAA